MNKLFILIFFFIGLNCQAQFIKNKQIVDPDKKKYVPNNQNNEFDNTKRHFNFGIGIIRANKNSDYGSDWGLFSEGGADIPFPKTSLILTTKLFVNYLSSSYYYDGNYGYWPYNTTTEGFTIGLKGFLNKNIHVGGEGGYYFSQLKESYPNDVFIYNNYYKTPPNQVNCNGYLVGSSIGYLANIIGANANIDIGFRWHYLVGNANNSAYFRVNDIRLFKMYVDYVF